MGWVKDKGGSGVKEYEKGGKVVRKHKHRDYKNKDIVRVLLKDGDVTDIVKTISGVDKEKKLKKFKEKQRYLKRKSEGKKFMDNLKGVKGDKIII